MFSTQTSLSHKKNEERQEKKSKDSKNIKIFLKYSKAGKY